MPVPDNVSATAMASGSSLHPLKLSTPGMRCRGEARNPQGSALQEVRKEEGGGSAHAHAGQLACGGVHGAVGQRPAGLPLGLAKHLQPDKTLHQGVPPAREASNQPVSGCSFLTASETCPSTELQLGTLIH